jgi:preprotein translocase subunit SecD
MQIVAIAFVIALGLLFMKDLNPLTFDANVGIEFIGGVRVPITLEHSVDSQTMGSMIDTIKTRINKFGLSQAVVRPLGDKEIIVEIPRAESDVIKSVEKILREQGKFEAIVDGKLALSGEHIIPNAVGGSGGENIQSSQGGASWSLVFAITGDGEMQFADAASGKTGSPVLMFLDRPQNAVLLVNKTILDKVPNDAISQVLRKEGDDIKLAYWEEFDASVLNGKTSVVVGKNALASSPAVAKALSDANFSESPEAEKRLLVREDSELIPTVFPSSIGSSISSWKAIGLRSAPTLQVDPIRQNAITQYSITGSSQGATEAEAEKNAVNELKELKSILSGGRLPVSTSIGSYYNVSPSLGRQFLFYSMMAVLVALCAVSLFLTLRYRKLELILPIVATSVIELVLLLALLGTFGTLDLSAMAGVIALIGTGVDNQIIITDEFSRKRKGEEQEMSGREKLSKAFFVVFTTAGVAIASMFPLFLSGIVEVMGFALATILGVIIGVAITRPAYGVLVEAAFGFKE